MKHLKVTENCRDSSAEKTSKVFPDSLLELIQFGTS
jgi:hypothetical protein